MIVTSPCGKIVNMNSTEVPIAIPISQFRHSVAQRSNISSIRPLKTVKSRNQPPPPTVPRPENHPRGSTMHIQRCNVFAGNDLFHTYPNSSIYFSTLSAETTTSTRPATTRISQQAPFHDLNGIYTTSHTSDSICNVLAAGIPITIGSAPFEQRHSSAQESTSCIHDMDTNIEGSSVPIAVAVPIAPSLGTDVILPNQHVMGRVLHISEQEYSRRRLRPHSRGAVARGASVEIPIRPSLAENCVRPHPSMYAVVRTLSGRSASSRRPLPPKIVRPP